LQKDRKYGVIFKVDIIDYSVSGYCGEKLGKERKIKDERRRERRKIFGEKGKWNKRPSPSKLKFGQNGKRRQVTKNIFKGKEKEKEFELKNTYFPNFFLIIERSGFPISSVKVLGSCQWFLILLLTLLAEVSSVSLPLVKVNMLGCVEMDGNPL
jgi:hypothetical protein